MDKLVPGQGFSQHVGNHVIGWAVDERYFASLGFLSDKVVLDVKVFGPGMMSRITGEGNARLIVLVDDCWAGLDES